MRPDPPRRDPRHTSGSRRPPRDLGAVDLAAADLAAADLAAADLAAADLAAADLAALRAVAALAQSDLTGPGSDPPAGQVEDRWTAVLDLLDAHLTGGRAHRAVTEHPVRPHTAAPHRTWRTTSRPTALRASPPDR